MAWTALAWRTLLLLLLLLRADGGGGIKTIGLGGVVKIIVAALCASSALCTKFTYMYMTCTYKNTR